MILKLRCTWMVYSMKFQHFKHFLALSGPTWKEQVCYRNPPLKWKSLKTSPIPQNSHLVMESGFVFAWSLDPFSSPMGTQPSASPPQRCFMSLSAPWSFYGGTLHTSVYMPIDSLLAWASQGQTFHRFYSLLRNAPWGIGKTSHWFNVIPLSDMPSYGKNHIF